MFNFDSIYDEIIDNRKSTALTEFKNEFEDVYCKLGANVIIKFQLMNNLSDYAKSIKIFNPKKLVINQVTCPNSTIAYNEETGVVQLRVSYKINYSIYYFCFFLFVKLENVSKFDAGEYECLVTNRCGTSSSKGRLHVSSNSAVNQYEKFNRQLSASNSDYKEISELARYTTIILINYLVF